MMELLLDLSDLPGYPVQERPLESVVKAYAEFVSLDPYDWEAVRIRKEREGIDLEGIGKWKHGVVPAEWLMAEIRRSCKFFPAPIEARKIYEKQFAPMDKRSSAELEEVLGSTGSSGKSYDED